MITLEEHNWNYFQWLLAKVNADKYGALCDEMHNVIFDARIPNDDNRASEGRDLRREYLNAKGLREPDWYQWLAPEASIFEMLVALTNRAGFQTSMPDHVWFEIFLENLGFSKFQDDVYCTQYAREVSIALTKFNQRRYRADGSGGLFPMRKPPSDQRRVEIWYQMCEYMAENEMY
jgi:hypothetical protein